MKTKMICEACDERPVTHKQQKRGLKVCKHCERPSRETRRDWRADRYSKHEWRV